MTLRVHVNAESELDRRSTGDIDGASDLNGAGDWVLVTGYW
jgi:hypothetical protein